MFGLVGVLFSLLAMLGIVAGLGFAVAMVVRGVRAAERRGDGRGDLEQLRRQLEQLQATVDQQAIDLDRLRASQDFTTRLLGERSGESRGGAS